MLHFIFGLWMLVVAAFHNQPRTLTKAVVNTPTPSPKVTLILTPTPTRESNVYIPTPTGAQLIDCVGPDGKHLKLSVSDCEKFDAAWGIFSTPTPQVPSNTNSNTQQVTPTQSSADTWVQAQAILQEKQSQYNTCASVAYSGLTTCEVGCGVVNGKVVVVYPNATDCLNNCGSQYQSALNVCVAQSKI